MISNNLYTMGCIGTAQIIMTLISAIIAFPKSKDDDYKTHSVIMSLISIVLVPIYFSLLLFTVIPSDIYSVPVSLYLYDDNTGEELFETGLADIYLQHIDEYELVSITDNANNVLFQNIGMFGNPENEEEFEVYAKKGVYISATISPIVREQLKILPIDIIQADVPGALCNFISLIINLLIITKYALSARKDGDKT